MSNSSRRPTSSLRCRKVGPVSNQILVSFFCFPFFTPETIDSTVAKAPPQPATPRIASPLENSVFWGSVFVQYIHPSQRALFRGVALSQVAASRF